MHLKLSPNKDKLGLSKVSVFIKKKSFNKHWGCICLKTHILNWSPTGPHNWPLHQIQHVSYSKHNVLTLISHGPIWHGYLNKRWVDSNRNWTKCQLENRSICNRYYYISVAYLSPPFFSSPFSLPLKIQKNSKIPMQSVEFLLWCTLIKPHGFKCFENWNGSHTAVTEYLSNILIHTFLHNV